MQTRQSLSRTPSRAEAPLRSAVRESGESSSPSRGISNRVTQRLVAQAKLRVNQPGDPFEREADRVADAAIAGMPDRRLRSDVPVLGRVPLVQRLCSHCEEELHRSATTSSPHEIAPAVESSIGRLRGSGSPLPDAVRGRFEPHFRRDFEDVRVHTSASAGETARAIGALAYTSGRDIVFAPGQYNPATREGQRLLAHELTHVVQQGDARPVDASAGEQVQRACGPAAIGPGGCPHSDEEPVGDLVLFRVNCDEFRNNAERAKAEEFADSMAVGDRVRVHGFASTDGDPTFNENLSCARAIQATAVLILNGVDPGAIEEFAHGPTPGPAAQRRSVVLERVPGLSRPAVPQLTPVVTVGPDAGNCGGANFVITWNLSRNSDAVDGGFVLQDITFVWNVVDCAGAAVPNPDPRVSPLHYFEAWRAAPGTTALSPVTTDTFFWPDAAPWAGGCTVGAVTITATARFHDGVAALPAHMVANNPRTFAGGLQSSLADPALGGRVSRPVAHELAFHWNCCPCSSSPTVIDGHTP